jgi:hypothetical protein
MKIYYLLPLDFFFQRLTGGTLLQRNKFYIVIYRGKDFLPSAVSTALAERQELAEDIQTIEEKTRGSFVGESLSGSVVDESAPDESAPVGTLAEFRQAMAQWGREVTPEERDAMREEASKINKNRLFRRIEHKLSIVSELAKHTSFVFGSNKTLMFGKEKLYPC